MRNREGDLIALERQVHLYSVDTKAFYTDEERDIDKTLSSLRRQQWELRQEADLLEQYYAGTLTESVARKRLAALTHPLAPDAPLPDETQIALFRQKAAALTPGITAEKERLRALLLQFDGVRELRHSELTPANVVSVFESYLTRTLEIAPGTLTMDLFVVRTYYFKVLQDIIERGFLFDGERFVIYTASAGQIRTKRSVFIRQSSLYAYSAKLMCGLTASHINALGGVNINKYLAYLALGNSATDEWTGFDIDRCIVVDDMETLVTDTVDYIDRSTYAIRRREMPVPITHTDGCGMVRPDISRKNFMVRLPWIKGLLAVFPFDKFIREANRAHPGSSHGIVTDIYGNEHDILAEDIQIIFTKSQFKMWNYYDDWVQYQTYFKAYSCRAGVCNVEEDTFEPAKINYQMLQTLVDLDDAELSAIAGATVETLRRISSDRNTMLSVFGATPGNTRKNAFQTALSLYPELLQDEYCRDTLRLIRAKLEKEARAGRLEVDGTYTYLVPDLYAYCQWLFLKDPSPSGLLEDGEIACKLFEPGAELDCLRSPHLYREHAVRTNVYGARAECRRWFLTNACYLSSHDLISKIIMCDWDGDKGLIVRDRTIVNAAKRNMAGIVPLYYEMVKAGARQITPAAVYESLTAAYTGGNIGQLSNDITRIWNSSPTPDLDAVKLLCLENNYVIDYAKTLYKPTRPEHIEPLIHPYTKGKVPYFFMEAKDKAPNQVAAPNESCVNRLRRLIPDVRLNFSAQSLGKFDWHMLTSSDHIPNNEITQRIIDTYRRRSSRMEFRFDETAQASNKHYLCQQLREELLTLYPDVDFIVDVLVKELFSRVKSRRKVVFWACFGQEVVANLTKNVDQRSKLCVRCGKRFYRESPRQVMCRDCALRQRRTMDAQRKRRARTASAF